MNAPRIVEKYEADLKRQRDYLDGIVHELDDDSSVQSLVVSSEAPS